MAKESTSSRIPRLDGVSRIPLSGSIRPPTQATSRRTQILRPTANFANQYNTKSISGLKPPALKKSVSSDRLSTAVNLVSKTSTALNKFFTKPDKISNTLQSPSLGQHDKVKQFLNENKKYITSNTPRPLTRSDTFVRGDSQSDMLGITHDVLVQSTQSPSNSDRRSALYTTHSLDASHQMLPKIGFSNTFNLASPVAGAQMMGQTTCVNTPMKTQQPYATLPVNLTKNLNVSTHVLGATMCMDTPAKHLPNQTQTLNNSQLIDKLIEADLTQTIRSGIRIVDHSGVASPATNATYSNPGSTDNLQMLDDVSIPSECEVESTLQPEIVDERKTYNNFLEFTENNMDNTLQILAPDKNNMKLPLNSTMNTERLLDLTADMLSPSTHLKLLNLTKDYMEMSPGAHSKNTSQLLYMTQISSSVATTPDRNLKFGETNLNYQHTPVPSHLLSPMLLKGAQSEMVLPIRTPDEDLMGEKMDIDTTLTAMGTCTDDFFVQASQQKHAVTGVAMSLQDVNNPNPKNKSRYSFGLDLTESTLDCSIELVDISLSSTALSQPNGSSVYGNMSLSPSTQQFQQQQQQQQLLKKQNSFEMDESLGILTPDQMKEFLDSTNTNTNNLELPLVLNTSCSNNNKLTLHQMRIDQTPSPEELPLDPVEVKTDISDVVFAQQQAAFCAAQQRQNMQHQNLQSSSISMEPVSQHTDTELSNKTDQMTKSSVSKISTSFITSVTSVTSLDTGYQGDGEMSRPASRGAGDHSPSNGPIARQGGGSHVSRQPSFHQQQQMPPIRRQDPMTDSDFFTESDADDIFHRSDRRAQVVIDGQLYGPSMMQSTASAVFISEDPQMEDSCMESSGIFTDVENRCDEDLAQMRQRQDANTVEPLSPDADGGDDSTETVKSIRESAKYKKGATTISSAHENETVMDAALGQGQLSCSQTSSTIQSSLSTDRLSIATTLSNRTSYCSVDGGTVNVDGKSFSSLEEVFDECNNSAAGSEQHMNASHMNAKRTKSSTTGNTSEQPKQKAKQLLSLSASVQRLSSPRKHASLTSLCNVKNNNNNNNNNNLRGSGAKKETRSESGSKVSLSDCVKPSNTPGKYYSPRAKCTQRGPPKSIATRTSASSPQPSPPPPPPPPLVVRKSHSPNKWDAVMNKIASNKSLIKKNYSDVKSKVSTRVNVAVVASSSAVDSGASAASPTVRRGSPTSVSSGPTSPNVAKVLMNARSSAAAHSAAFASDSSLQPTDTGLRSLQSPQTKRLLQAAIKCGRSYSKDSQKSSQSDLSLASGLGSPKLLAKTPLRAGKKRDVRNLSISPTDLGPPPKTQQTANGISTRPKTTAGATITNKRFPVSTCPSPSATSTAASSPTNNNGIASIKGSPSPVKKLTITAKRLDVKASPAKTPLKDHNRIIGKPLAPTPPTAKNVSDRKLESATELHEIGNGIVHHHHNNNITTANSTEKLASANNTRTSSQESTSISSSASPTPLLAGQHGRKISAATAAVLLDKKSQSKLETSRKLLLHKQQQQQQQRSTEEAPATPRAECLDAAELQQLKLLNRHSCNGRLDYGALERHLQQTEQVQQQQGKGVEALGVLLQYLVYDMDAFACPTAKSESFKAKETLTKALQMLDEVKGTCTELQEQLCDKEAYYTQREEELQVMHRCELDKATAKLDDLQMLAERQKSELNHKLADKDAENRRALDSYRLEMDNKFLQKQQQLLAAEDRERALQARLDAAERAEQEIRERLTSSERKYENGIKECSGRERELCDHVKILRRELEKMRESAQGREQDLKDKLNLSQDEISVLRTSHKSFNESLERGTSPRNSGNASAASLEITRLQSEAESLRCVLELKQKEISKLTKHNEELVRDADERIALQGKISLLEARNEMLQSELEIKSDKEKEFLRQIDDIQKAFSHETVKRTRLSYDNEALQWQLKQRSEQLHIVEAKLQELSAYDSLLNHTSSTQGSLNRCTLPNGSSYANSSINNMEDISPPASPLIKGVIEKTDSVSWVLEMDDETPEAAASKMVKRAGSFRSVERSPSTRRHLSVSASAATNSLATSTTASTSNSGPNPLSQSMSATSVIRQHSSESVAEVASRSHARIRSKSVSVKSGEETAATTESDSNNKKMSRQHPPSGGNSRKHELMPGAWKEPLVASSPYVMRPRSSTKISADVNAAQDESSSLFRRASSTSASSRKLITCDTSTLNSGERLEQRSLPSHPSVHNLKTLKKCQAVQESAGEAMVSGTNSEDESCSASSDEIACSTSTSSATSGSMSSLNQIKNSHMSLEEALLLDKINSLNGTPMEVSWSDDAGDAFTNGAAV